MEGQKVRQLIGSMLELLPAIPGSASQLEKCIIPTICALIKAPKSHPLSEVNVMDVLKFVLTLCSTCVEVILRYTIRRFYYNRSNCRKRIYTAE